MSDFQVSIRKSIRPCGKIFISFPSRPRRRLANVEFAWKWPLMQCWCLCVCMYECKVTSYMWCVGTPASRQSRAGSCTTRGC